jgi:putative protease
MKEVGVVTHYFTKISVAIVEMKDTISVGDRILIRGGLQPFTTNLEQIVESMQIEHKNFKSAGTGQSIGLKVNQRVKEGDKVYKIIS